MDLERKHLLFEVVELVKVVVWQRLHLSLLIILIWSELRI